MSGNEKVLHAKVDYYKTWLTLGAVLCLTTTIAGYSTVTKWIRAVFFISAICFFITFSISLVEYSMEYRKLIAVLEKRH